MRVSLPLTPGSHGTARRRPTVVARFEELGLAVASVSCGDHHAAAVTTSGDLYVWGRGDTTDLLAHARRGSHNRT